MKKLKFLKLSFIISIISFSILILAGCSLSDFVSIEQSPEYIINSYINDDDELIIEYSNNTIQNLGVVVGKDGKDGVDGIDGIDGTDGIDGKDGKDGAIIIQGGSDETSITHAVANAIQSAVIIQSSYVDPLTSQTSYSSGAGVIYSCNKSTGDAIIVTNYHVVYNVNAQTQNKICETIEVFLYGSVTTNKAMNATYIGGSLNYDIAVLKISNSDMIKNSDVKAVQIKDSSSVHVGDTAIAIGNPRAEGFSVTSGIISVDSESIDLTLADEKTTGSIRVMRIDTPVNSGNSGGGLFDKNGNLIGIVNAKYADAKVDNIGYAIPSSTVVAITENLLDYCLDSENETIKRPLLGVKVQIQNPYSKYDPETGYVELYEESTVVEITSINSIAFGRLQVGDVIKKLEIVDSEKSFEIQRQYQLLDALLHARVGDTVLITVDRGGEFVTETIFITEDCITTN